MTAALIRLMACAACFLVALVIMVVVLLEIPLGLMRLLLVGLFTELREGTLIRSSEGGGSAGTTF